MPFYINNNHCLPGAWLINSRNGEGRTGFFPIFGTLGVGKYINHDLDDFWFVMPNYSLYTNSGGQGSTVSCNNNTQNIILKTSPNNDTVDYVVLWYNTTKLSDPTGLTYTFNDAQPSTI